MLTFTKRFFGHIHVCLIKQRMQLFQSWLGKFSFVLCLTSSHYVPCHFFDQNLSYNVVLSCFTSCIFSYERQVLGWVRFGNSVCCICLSYFPLLFLNDQPLSPGHYRVFLFLHQDVSPPAPGCLHESASWKDTTAG